MPNREFALTCPEPLAAAAGGKVFSRGGNAMDAAVAAAFAQSVVNPLMCGLGGDAFFCVYDPRSGETVILEAPVTIGTRAVPNIFESRARGHRVETVGRFLVDGDINQLGYKAVMVPGLVRGLGDGFSRYGSRRVTWQDVVAPAIDLAANGYEIDHVAARAWRSQDRGPGVPDVFTKLNATPEACRLYLKPGGTAYRVGDHIKLSDLARTLERIASRGPDEFYTGEIARQIARDIEAGGGLWTLEDLRSYRIRERLPVWGTYRGLRVASCPPPGAGATIIEMLQILEHADLGARSWNSPGYLNLLGHAFVAAFADAAAWQGDPAFADVPVATWISKEHAAGRFASLGHYSQRALPETSPQPVPPAAGERGTTHVTAVDENGMIVSLNMSTGSTGASGVVTPGLGFLYNNFMGQFDPIPGRRQSIAPGKGSGGASSTIVFGSEGPMLGTGAAGGSRLISAIVQSVVNMVDHRMAPAEAVAVPRVHAEEPWRMIVEPGFDDVTVDSLAELGWEVRTSTYMGRVAAVAIDPIANALSPASDPRGGRGVAAGHR